MKRTLLSHSSTESFSPVSYGSERPAEEVVALDFLPLLGLSAIQVPNVNTGKGENYDSCVSYKLHFLAYLASVLSSFYLII
jgi:hypothetical protein